MERVKRNLPDVYFGTDDWQAVRLIIRRLSTLKYALSLSLPAVVRGRMRCGPVLHCRPTVIIQEEEMTFWAACGPCLQLMSLARAAVE